ncbi:general transcription repressor [Elasticomyces elasticus]|nr:general transcription repressor [Elasticomyces elasticus]
MANNSYQQITSTLMAGNAENPVPYVGLDQLRIYQGIYGDSAYPCRVPGCLRESNAFATEDERKQHESTHVVRYTCRDLSCPFAILGFTTTKKLKNHETEFHPRESHAEIPTVLGHCYPSLTQEAQSRSMPEHEGTTERTAGSMTEDVGNMLADLDITKVEPQFRKQGDVWSAVFNPNIDRTFDIELAQTLGHIRPELSIMAVCFSEDGNMLVTASAVEMQVFSVRDGQRLSCFLHPQTAEGVVGCFNTVCFHSTYTHYLITGSADSLIRIWNVADVPDCRGAFAGHKQAVHSIACSHDGEIIASGSADATICIWRWRHSKEFWDDVKITFVHSLYTGGIPTSVVFSPDSQFIASSSILRRVRIWRVLTGKLIAETAEHSMDNDAPKSVVFSLTGSSRSLLITAGADRIIEIWKFLPESTSLELVTTLNGHKTGAFNCGI